MMQREKMISVIIPVYNDSKRLELCLDALENQSYPRSLFEIIVVDNCSDDTVEKLAKDYPRVIFCQESEPGSYSARNKGITLAKGEILAFTDSDCIPDSQWLLHGSQVLSSAKDIGLVGGRVDFFFKDEDNPRIPELYDSLTYLQQDKAVTIHKFAATANMFTRRRVMDHVGMFDTNLKSGGDRNWGERVAAAGYNLKFISEAVVRHPARSTFSEIRKRNIRVHGGHHQLHSRSEGRLPLLLLGTELAVDLSPPVRFIWRLRRDKRVSGLKNKILLTGFHVLAKLDIALARIKYQLGCKPSRS